MSKYFKFLVLAALALGLTAGSVFAGTLVDTGETSLTAFTVAKELVNAADTDVEVGTKVTDTDYTPSAIPLGSLSDAIVVYQLSAGTWAVTGTPQICDGATLIATYKSGDGTDTLIFDTAGGGSGVMTNGVAYDIKKNGGADCNSALALDDLVITIPKDTTGITLTAKAGIATTQTIYDTASGSFIAPTTQFSVTAPTGDNALNALIDYEQSFKKLYEGGVTTTSDDLTMALVVADLDWDVNDTTAGDNETLTYTINVTDMTGISTAAGGVQIVTGGDTNNCTVSTTAKTITCTTDAADFTVDTESVITINVDTTTVIGEKTFTASATLDFADAAALDYGTSNKLISSGAAGSWTNRGTSVYVPLIKTSGDGTVETYIKLQAKENCDVRGIVLLSNGSQLTVTLGSITKGTPKLISGADIKNAVTSGGGSVDGSAGFAVILSITSDKSNIYGLATMVDSSSGTAQWRRIPLNVNSESGLD